MQDKLESVRAYFQALSTLERPAPAAMEQDPVGSDRQLTPFETKATEAISEGKILLGYIRIVDLDGVNVPVGTRMTKDLMKEYVVDALASALTYALGRNGHFVPAGVGEFLVLFPNSTPALAEGTLRRAASEFRTNLYQRYPETKILLDRHAQQVPVDPTRQVSEYEMYSYLREAAPTLEERVRMESSERIRRSRDKFVPYWSPAESRLGLNLLRFDLPQDMAKALKFAETPEAKAAVSSIVDSESVARAANQIEYHGTTRGRPQFLVQVSALTLTHGDARHMMKAVLGHLDVLRSNAVIEIVDVPSDRDWLDALRNDQASLALFGCGLRVVMSLEADNLAAVVPFHSFLHGVSTELPRGVRPNEARARLGALSSLAQRAKLSTYVHGIDSVSSAQAAADAGIDWIGGTAVMAKGETPRPEMRYAGVTFRVANVA